MQKLCERKFAKFCEGAEFRAYAYAINCSRISLGRRVVIRPGSMLFGNIRFPGKGRIFIEDDVLVGSGVHIYVSNHRFGQRNVPIIDQGHFEPQDTILKKGSWIGANSLLLPGVIIGENAIIGAGSVVAKSIPANVVAAGNPARILRQIS